MSWNLEDALKVKETPSELRKFIESELNRLSTPKIQSVDDFKFVFMGVKYAFVLTEAEPWRGGTLTSSRDSWYQLVAFDDTDGIEVIEGFDMTASQCCVKPKCLCGTQHYYQPKIRQVYVKSIPAHQEVAYRSYE